MGVTCVGGKCGTARDTTETPGRLSLTLTIQLGAFCVHPITRSVLIMPVSESIDRSVMLFCAKVSVARAKKKREKARGSSTENRPGAWRVGERLYGARREDVLD